MLKNINLSIKEFWRSLNVNRVASAIAVIILVILCFIVSRIVDSTRYIDINIETPDSYMPQGGWSYIEKSIQKWSSSESKYYILRKETYLNPSITEGISSLESIIQYFDDRLNESNWELYSVPGDNPCKFYLRESRFLIRGNGGYFIYRRPDAIISADEPTVCLAIWPFSVDSDGYNVVLVTVNPSLLTYWFDD